MGGYRGKLCSTARKSKAVQAKGCWGVGGLAISSSFLFPLSSPSRGMIMGPSLFACAWLLSITLAHSLARLRSHGHSPQYSRHSPHSALPTCSTHSSIHSELPERETNVPMRIRSGSDRLLGNEGWRCILRRRGRLAGGEQGERTNERNGRSELRCSGGIGGGIEGGGQGEVTSELGSGRAKAEEQGREEEGRNKSVAHKCQCTAFQLCGTPQ